MSESFPPSSPPTLAGDIDAEMKDDEAGRVPSSQFAPPTEPRPFSPLMHSISGDSEKVEGGVQESKEKSKEELAEEAKERKIKALNARIESLTTELATTKEKLGSVTGELKQPATQTVKQHIKLLHEYNEIKDIGQGLLGMIAGNRGLRISDVYEEFGVGFND